MSEVFIYIMLSLLVGVAIGVIIERKRFNKRLSFHGIIGGKDAERFNANMEKAKTQKVSQEERDRIINTYNKIMAKAKL